MNELPRLNSVASIVGSEDDGWTVILENGVILPVTDFFDCNGDECEPEDAVVCVAGRDGYGWMSISLVPDCFEYTVH